MILAKTKPERVGQHPFDPIGERLDRPRWPDDKSLRARSQHQWLELGHRRGGRGRAGAARLGTETDGSIVSPAVDLLPCRAQADGRPNEPAGIVPSRIRRTRGADDAQRRRRGAALRGDGWRDSDDGDLGRARRPRSRRARCRALRGARLGVARAFFTGFDEADALIDKAIVDLKRLGAEIVDPVDLALPSYNDAELRVLLHELKADLPKYLASFAADAKVKTLADVIAFNRAHREREMPWFGQELFEKAEALGGLDTKEYLDALAECRKGARDDGLERVLRRIASTRDRADGGPAWLIDRQRRSLQREFSTPAAVAGYPHLTVPAGLVRGLPSPVVRRRGMSEARRWRSHATRGDEGAARAAFAKRTTPAS